MDETTVDLVCVGGGLGGLAAAVTGAERGLSVEVLEASDRIGGVAAYSGGIVWVPGNHLLPEADQAEDLERGADYLAHVAGRGLDHDADLRASLLGHAHSAIAFLADRCGVDFTLTGLPDQYHGHVPTASPGGRTLEVTTEGVQLGPWLERLREGPFQPPYLTVREAVGASSPNVAYAALGEQELARRRERELLVRGRGLVGALLRDLLRRGVEPRLETRVRELIVEDGAVVGVTCEQQGRPWRLLARRGVVLATGSYGYASWRARMEGLPEVFDQGPPVTHGDGITLTDPTPAALVRGGNGFTVLGYASSTRTHPGTDRPLHIPLYDSLGYPHSIVVNRAGERFGDESFYSTFSGAISRFDSARKAYPNFPAYLVVDDRFRRNGYILGDHLDPWPASAMMRAASLEELATVLGIDPVGLSASVARFNADVERGIDHQFGRGSLATSRNRHGDPSYPNPNLGAIGESPFWGLPLRILAAGIYSHGLHLSPDAEVLDRHGRAVPGLFATGNVAAYVDVPGGYENGLANLRNITYAYLAANTAARGQNNPSGRRGAVT